MYRKVMLALFLGMISISPAAAQNASWAERITLSGDYRVRHEGFYNQKTPGGAKAPARNRIRVRGRFTLTTAINPYATLNLRVATGNPENPISANESLDRFFKRPTLSLDRGFIRLSYTAGAKTASADLGKMSNPAYAPSQMVWDNDLNPTGMAERFSIKGKGALKQFDATLMQYTVEEVGAGKDAWMFGAQTRLTLAPRKGLDVSFSVGDYRYFNANLIAKLGSAAVTKANRKDANGNFLSEFNLVNLTGDLTLQTGAPAYPVSVFADVVVNTGAKKDAAGKKENTGFFTGFRVGRASNPGEVSLSFTYLKVRQDAVLTTFAFDDVYTTDGRAADGRQGAIVEIGIPLLPKTTLTVTGLFTSLLHGPVKSTLFRTQTDLSVQF